MTRPNHTSPLLKFGPSFLVLIWAWFAVAKLVSTFYFTPPGDSIFNLSFGFGHYVESLFQTGTFESCVNELCDRASRMPLMPIFYALIAHISTSLLAAAAIKNLTLSIIVISLFRFLLHKQAAIHCGAVTVWSFVCLGLSLSLPVIKHASSVFYEEGFLTELLFLWAFSLLMGVQLLARNDEARSGRNIVLSCLALALSAFFIKSSMLFVLLVSLILALLWAVKFRDLRTLMAVCLCIVAVGAWGIRNSVATGHFSVMTSWDGSNAYKSWSDESFQLYPDVVLDRLLDAKVAYKADGAVVTIKNRPCPASHRDEWACDAYYKSLASGWLITHPSEALQFSLRKTYQFFIGIEKTPYTYTNDARPSSNQPLLEKLATSTWLFAGRVLELGMLMLAYLLWRQKDLCARALVLGVVTVNIAYATPYLIGFNYERHVTVYLVLVAVCVAVMLAELMECNARFNETDRSAELCNDR